MKITSNLRAGSQKRSGSTDSATTLDTSSSINNAVFSSAPVSRCVGI